MLCAAVLAAEGYGNVLKTSLAESARQRSLARQAAKKLPAAGKARGPESPKRRPDDVVCTWNPETWDRPAPRPLPVVKTPWFCAACAVFLFSQEPLLRAADSCKPCDARTIDWTVNPNSRALAPPVASV